AGLGTDDVGGRGVNQEAERVAGGDEEVTGQQLGGVVEEDRVDIPLHDELDED
ncbi:hypothetical protein Dimus_034070, partial [Dionaea muscipula]